MAFGWPIQRLIATTLLQNSTYPDARDGNDGSQWETILENRTKLEEARGFICKAGYSHSNGALNKPDAPDAPGKSTTALPTPDSSPGIASQKASPVQSSIVITPHELSPVQSTIKLAATPSPDATDPPNPPNPPDPPDPPNPPDPDLTIELYSAKIMAGVTEFSSSHQLKRLTSLRKPLLLLMILSDAQSGMQLRPRPDYKAMHTGKLVLSTLADSTIGCGIRLQSLQEQLPLGH